jgi:hypothetical protein
MNLQRRADWEVGDTAGLQNLRYRLGRAPDWSVPRVKSPALPPLKTWN